MEQNLKKILKYFSLFAYYPTLEEIHTFLPVKIHKDELKRELEHLKYTPPQYSIRRKISKIKLNDWRFRAYIKLISTFPQIKLVGLSGSISMMNASENDDIDLFVITAKNRLFTGRFTSLLLAQLIGIRRNRLTYSRRPSQIGNKNKICLNLFFDESDLKVPKFKQTEFVGHEALQMKPIIVKDNVYKKFLEANRWVFKLFPNARENLEFRVQNSELKNRIINSKLIILNFGWIIESIVKKIQLLSINRHKTSEIITSTQLWFHPVDFGKKINKQRQLKIVKNGYKLL